MTFPHKFAGGIKNSIRTPPVCRLQAFFHHQILLMSFSTRRRSFDVMQINISSITLNLAWEVQTYSGPHWSYFLSLKKEKKLKSWFCFWSISCPNSHFGPILPPENHHYSVQWVKISLGHFVLKAWQWDYFNVSNTNYTENTDILKTGDTRFFTQNILIAIFHCGTTLEGQ